MESVRSDAPLAMLAVRVTVGPAHELVEKLRKSAKDGDQTSMVY